MTIQDIIQLVQREIPAKLDHDTVDTLKSGDPLAQVRGIAVTFMATHRVLKQAVENGSNLIITHEPTFYNHHDDLTWLATDPVATAKKKWIEDHGLAIWRLHDGLHRWVPDAIDAGVIKKLGWTFDSDPARRKVFSIPAQSARDLAEGFKQRLGITQVRVAGDLGTICTRVGLRLGACGGRSQIELFRDEGVDVVVCGESPEWETCEYVRDAVEMGGKKALIVLGHANSEQAGMEWLADWLKPILPAKIPLCYLPAGDPFCFV